MRQPHWFNLLIVHGDSTRVLRLNLPRWIPYGSLIVLALAVSTLGAISGEYVSMKREVSQVVALQRRTAEQHALIESFHARIAKVRGEVSSWRSLHAKIWEPFGPEAGPAPKETGIGGGEPVRAALSGDGGTLSHELDLLSATVNEEGQSLRALQRFMAKVGRVLAVLPAQARPRRGDPGIRPAALSPDGSAGVPQRK